MNLPIINAVTPISGGVISLSGTKIIHTFLTSGSLVVPPGLMGNVEILIIGGGGAGGNYAGGGGGAGEDVYVASHAISGQTYTVTVGDGGVGNRGQGVWNSWGAVSNAPNGENSVFDNLTAHGGGGGGATHNTVDGVGNDGACGGGGTWLQSGSASAGGSGTYGNNGGNGYASDGYSNSGGGGGGQSAVGANSGSGTGGNGGAGVAYNISGASVNYCGGGGGGVNKDGTVGTASYGGGAGSKTGNGTAGTEGTGGGGGGAYGGSTGGYYGGDGGSGIVIVSYSLEDLSLYFFSTKRTFIPFRGTSRFLNYTI